ncbi:MAG: DNA polymerase III subunit delta [Sedimentisphaerales bacterium]|nr:DNA polymerase III subunit delta [Sedimentisphaerales bacterium]
MKKQEIKPVYVLAGKDEFLLAEQLNSLLARLLEPEQRQMCLRQSDGADVTAAEVFDELRTLPFLGDRRVVVLTDAEKFVSENRGLLEKYFESPASSGVLVLVVGSWPGNTKLAKALPKVGQLIEVAELKQASLVSYVRNYANAEHSKSLSFNAAQMLVEVVGDEPGILCREVDKLATYTTAKAITEKDISELCGHNRIFGAFEVIDSMTAGDTAKAIEKLRIMFSFDRDAEYTVVGAFAWHFRRMFSASAMLKNGDSPATVAKKLRIFWNKDAFFSTLKKMTLEKLGDCLKQLAEIDYAIKTGRATAQTAIESMIIQLAKE